MLDFYKLMSNDKRIKSEFSKLLFSIITEIYETARILTQWNEAIIVPVPQKSDLHSIDNHRGISSVNTLCKVVMKMVIDKITRICDANRIHRCEQDGFRKLEKCVAQATCFYEIIKRKILEKHKTIAIFLGLSKAYDRMLHEGLFAKLQSYDFGGKLLNFIKAIHIRPMSSVKMGDKRPNLFDYNTGVKRGYPASPILFTLYINDLFEGFIRKKIGPNTSVPNLLFADDAVLFTEDCDEAKSCIPRIKQGCAKRKIEHNIMTCSVMTFNTETTAIIKYKNMNILQVSSYRYLELPIDGELNMNTIINDRKDR
ncbi:putative RNA-directed DNA polymerase (reverse transcriptase), Non LTR Retrotransposon protein [Trachipleistophora hominis]|uniref:Putative RNA-directed DNA polymerase (Reverse transcriptase), Non LTR Retrotransposon protein n=1 Tax=Trachipleistophora hominis TaxID=72359 RepID=L7JU38_TRAHO|nr:putative RNA-directed DNA polymerase (reverse transcriptase), Non LTR Retrotransposon protein [Trachipleistophora hominis]